MNINVLPNIISFARLGIASGIFFATCHSLYSMEWYLYMFITGYITDAADGMLARWLCASSNFGAWVDLLADKMLFFSIWTYIALMSKSSSIVFCIILLSLREVAAIVMREYAASYAMAMPVQSHGKFKTIFLGLVTIYTLLQLSLFSDYLVPGLWIMGVVMSWLSFFRYVHELMYRNTLKLN